MDKELYLTSLYDYYQGLLTDKQRSYFEDYYFENLTMEEIAENYEVSKNAISKSLIEVKEKLEEYERILKLKSNRDEIERILDSSNFEKIEEYI